MDERFDEIIPTRASLLQRLKDWGDQTSWQDFFDTYWNLIYGMATKGGLAPAEAEDVVQETMISVAKQMPGFKYDPSMGSFKGWLLVVTRSKILDHLRARKLPGRSAATEADHAALEGMNGESEFEKSWDAEWENNLLHAAVNKARRRLDPQQYQIFDFAVNKAWPPERVAKMLSVSVNQVYLAKHRVTEAIKQEVERLKKEVV